MRGKKILVTGGAGFIGSHLVEALLAQGGQVTVIDNLSTGNLENLDFAESFNGRLAIKKLDILNREALASVFTGADCIFHLATQNVRLSLRQPAWVSRVNVEGTLNVLEEAARAKVRRFVYCSSSEVNGTAKVVPMQEDYPYAPETIYGASKLTGEFYTQVFHRSGWLNTVIARPHNNYGPRAHSFGISEEIIPKFILAALAGEDLQIYGSGQQTRDFTYVSETVDSLLGLGQRVDLKGETFNICRGEEVAVLEIAQTILALTESKSRIVHGPERKNDVLRLWGDNSKLRQALGHAPSKSLRDGLKLTVDWYRSRPEAWFRQRQSMKTILDQDTWPYEDWIAH